MFAHQKLIVFQVFRWAVPQSMLFQRAAVTLRRLITTRFMFVFSALHHFQQKNCLKHLRVIVQSPAFSDFKEGRPAEDQQLITDAVKAIQSRDFDSFISFFLRLMSPWVQAMREFDKARNNISLVRPLFRELLTLAGNTFSDGEFEDYPSLVVKNKIATVISKFVSKFDRPIFSAAFALDPTCYDEIGAMALTRPPEYMLIQLHLREIFTLLAMRGSIEEGPARFVAFDSPRPLPDARLVAEEAYSEFRTEFVFKKGKWAPNIPFWASLADGKMAPVDLYLIDAPHESLLAKFALVILSIVPSTSQVERGHKDNRNAHTAARNRIGSSKLDFILRTKAIFAHHRYQQAHGASARLNPSEFLALLSAPMDPASVQHAVADELHGAVVVSQADETAAVRDAHSSAEAAAEPASPMEVSTDAAVAPDVMGTQEELRESTEDGGALDSDVDILAAGLDDIGADYDVMPDEVVQLDASDLAEESAIDNDIQDELLTGMHDRSDRRDLSARARASILPRRFRDFVL